MRVALLFIDGVGLGRRDPDVNPLARHELLLSQFEDGSGTRLEGGHLLRLDPTFGVAGRPQSATNQTALFTGLPAPALLGRHLVGFPNAFLRDLLLQSSIAKKLREQQRTVTFANGYPSSYLDTLGLLRREAEEDVREIPARIASKLRPSASTLAMSAGGVALRTVRDIREGRALTADIDGKSERARSVGAPSRSCEEAAEIFVSLAAAHDFTLFEHYLADEAGHLRDFALAEQALCTFDTFARAVVSRATAAGVTVVICSDHGNVEDLSTRNHTLSRIPVLLFGAEPRALSSVETLADLGNSLARLSGASE